MPSSRFFPSSGALFVSGVNGFYCSKNVVGKFPAELAHKSILIFPARINCIYIEDFELNFVTVLEESFANGIFQGSEKLHGSFSAECR